MMKSKELRAKAWNSLKGKYWLAFIVLLVTGALCSIGNGFVTLTQNITDLVNMVDPSEMDSTMELGAAVLGIAASGFGIIGLVMNIFVENAVTVGLSNYFIKNTDSKPSFADAFSGFKVKYLRNCGTLFLMGIKLALWSMLFVSPGIIKSFEYAMIPYILADDAEISSKEAFQKARELMKGNKWRLFKLDFSFIGWYALCFLTLGLGTFFLLPYLNAATAEFYVELKNK